MTARRRCRFWSSWPSSARIPASGPFRAYALTLYNTIYSILSLLIGLCNGSCVPVYCGAQGMVDPGEFVTTTLRREFAEEALDLEGADEKTKHAIEKRIDEAFADGKEVRCIRYAHLTLSYTLSYPTDSVVVALVEQKCHSCYLTLVHESTILVPIQYAKV